jgi:hypothetical protein
VGNNYLEKPCRHYQELEEESGVLVQSCKYCTARLDIPIEATDAIESGITKLLLPENHVRWLRTGTCGRCYRELVPKTLQFLNKYADCLPIELEKEDLPYFNLLFPRRNARHIRLLLNMDEMMVVRNSNLRWKELEE